MGIAGQPDMTSRSIYTPTGQRKYLSAPERQAFIKVCEARSRDERRFCLALLWTGGRLSEVLSLTAQNLSPDEGVVIFRTLKQRNNHTFRHVPLHAQLLSDLSGMTGSLFPWGRTQAWQIVKDMMKKAQIEGPQACPRGLRHSFAIHAISSGVPLHMVQRWMGHRRLETTAIYTQALGAEERQIAQLMWD